MYNFNESPIMKRLKEDFIIGLTRVIFGSTLFGCVIGILIGYLFWGR